MFEIWKQVYCGQAILKTDSKSQVRKTALEVRNYDHEATTVFKAG